MKRALANELNRAMFLFVLLGFDTEKSRRRQGLRKLHAYALQASFFRKTLYS